MAERKICLDLRKTNLFAILCNTHLNRVAQAALPKNHMSQTHQNYPIILSFTLHSFIYLVAP